MEYIILDNLYITEEITVQMQNLLVFLFRSVLSFVMLWTQEYLFPLKSSLDLLIIIFFVR